MNTEQTSKNIFKYSFKFKRSFGLLAGCDFRKRSENLRKNFLNQNNQGKLLHRDSKVNVIAEVIYINQQLFSEAVYYDME